MKYYAPKFNGESLNDVFNGSEFESCLRDSKEKVKKWADEVLELYPSDYKYYEVLEIDVKVIEKVKKK